MDKFTSNRIISLLVFLLILLSIMFFGQRRLSKVRESQWEAAVNAKSTQAEIWRDKYNRSNAKIEHIEVSHDIFRKANAKLLDSLKRELNIKPKTVKEYIEVTTEIALPPKTIFIANDSTFIFEDEWAKIEGTVHKDSLSISANFISRLRYIKHDERYGFLNLKTKTISRFVTDNPYETITGVRQMEVLHKQKPVTFGLQVGYGITPKGLSPYVGFGASIRVSSSLR
jgi:predicted RND superfamily exporter protein